MSRAGRHRPHKHRTALRVALVIVIAATVTVMFWRLPLAWVPALIAAIVYGMDLLLEAIDRRARRASLPPTAETERDRAVHAAEERVGVRTALTIGVGLAAIAVVIAAAFLDWKLAGLGALAIFAWMALLGLPFWAAAVEEEIETEHDRLTGESRSIR